MARLRQLALAGALGATALLPLIWLLATRTGTVHALDARILDGFMNLDGPAVHPVAQQIARLCDPDRFVWLVAALLAVALARRRPRTAAAVAVVVVGSGLTTQLLKPALATPRHSPLLVDSGQVLAASWPSGHATAAMAVALCATLVAPARLRAWSAALGAVFAVAVTFSFLTLGWHYPSDVLGGFLVASAWTLAAVAALSWAAERWPAGEGRRWLRDRDGAGRVPGAAPEAGHAGSRHDAGAEREAERARRPLREALAPAGVTAACGVLLAAMVALARPTDTLDYAADHTVFVVGAGALAVAALALATGFGLLLLRARRR
jgi:membrane-associated phospholipid phosphatase